MGRVARAVVAGCPHHVTQRGNRRGDVFEVDEDRGAYLLFLQRAEALPWSSSPAAQTRTYVTARPVEASVERMKIRKFVVCPRISTVALVGLGIGLAIAAGHKIRCAVILRRYYRYKEKLEAEAEKKYPIPAFLQGDCDNVPSGKLERDWILDQRKDWVKRRLATSKEFYAVIRYCGFEPAYGH
jgi:hypothetical protein